MEKSETENSLAQAQSGYSQIDALPIDAEKARILKDIVAVHGPNGSFVENDLSIHCDVDQENRFRVAPVPEADMPKKGALIARIDFMPRGSSEPSDTERSQRMVMGFEALEDFVTLAELGLVLKPDFLVGDTNEVMAKISERVGFSNKAIGDGAPHYSSHVVYAKYDDLKHGLEAIDPQLKDCLRARSAAQKRPEEIAA
jgi:hypothetical protein